MRSSTVRTVQMTLDPELVAEVDEAARRLCTTRSAFTRDALAAALARLRERELEERHRQGYLRLPVRPGELDGWDDAQVWPD